jgi:hypothetical protein
MSTREMALGLSAVALIIGVLEFLYDLPADFPFLFAAIVVGGAALGLHWRQRTDRRAATVAWFRSFTAARSPTHGQLRCSLCSPHWRERRKRVRASLVAWHTRSLPRGYLPLHRGHLRPAHWLRLQALQDYNEV